MAAPTHEASRESATRFGRPVDPEVSISSGSGVGASSQSASGRDLSGRAGDGTQAAHRRHASPAVEPRTGLRFPAAELDANQRIRCSSGTMRDRTTPRDLRRAPLTDPAPWRPPRSGCEGARPRTLPAAISPVLAGTGVAAFTHDAVWWKALLALRAVAGAAGGRQLRQRLLRRRPWHRRGPGRPAPAGRLRRGHARAPSKRAAFTAFGVGAAARPGAGRDHGLVAGRGRRASASWPPGSTPAGRTPTATSGSAR